MMGAHWPEPDPMRLRDWLAVAVCLAGLAALGAVLWINRIFNRKYLTKGHY